jgi:GT2 family glycosyltransferase
LEVIVVNYNSTGHLIRCLESLYQTLGEGVRVLVIDNASQDGPTRLRDRFPRVELTLNRRNLGFATAVNQGLAKCRQPWIMLLNPDTVLKPQGWLETLSWLEANPRVALLGPRILDPDGQVQGSARSFHSLHTAFFGRQALLSRWFPRNPWTKLNVLTSAQENPTPREVDWVSGACLLARREAVLRVGGLDERFFLYFEDTDWCRRMWRGGWKVVYYPLAEVEHQIAASGGKENLRPLWEFHRSCYHYLEKYALAERPWLRLPVALLVGARFYVLGLTRLGKRLLAFLRSKA